MTEFEEIALKKITKEYLINRIYHRINLISDQFGISNSEISKYIGWDPAGYNQKYNRSNDLRITTFIKIFVALQDLIAEVEKKSELFSLDNSKVELTALITEKELGVAKLYNHVSAVAEGRCEFFCEQRFADTFIEMKSFVLMIERTKRITDSMVQVYAKYYKELV